MMDPAEAYKEHKILFWSIVLIGIPLVLLIGSILLKELFWDAFLWRYIWGPVVADARGEQVNGISAGYNIVNTLVYAVSMVVALLGILEIFQRYDIEMDRSLMLSLMPWVILGGTFRSLEDAGFFSSSISPFFISPVIYFVLGIGAILTLVLGSKLSSMEPNLSTHMVRALSLLPPLIFALMLNPPYVNYVLLLLAGVTVISYLIGYHLDTIGPRYLLSSYGTSLLAFTLFYISYYLLTLDGTRPFEIGIILLLTIVSSSILFGIVWLLSFKFSNFKTFLTAVNPLIVFAHMLDASATYRGISAYGYVEKHVLPALAIDLIGTSLVMYPLKIVLIFLVIYSLDVWYYEELKEIPNVKRLLQFAVIVLGLAPGVRNMLRLAMGV